ncbi:Uncharacterized SAM-binding protein YcdF, DUF218 family [Mycolicibacterium rutilum]|uniref:Uncharacterized SAM-binding protein YcdF, DUF218 family n=1 Tax=Mycolicibacterium rutilum TaxID=370526 RepID=A0A1H6LQP3_MYCRU|nr:YdcF family protein [Mycolicibacterium rutilum]SEH90997.1 Uncharacterized SAM-binding protein YcdF, DUF218 family [Mycolicibacterium rutilum]
MRSTDTARIAFEAVAVVVVIVLIDLTVAGFVLFTNAAGDELQKADAILVLAGEHDGREEHGIALARAGWAGTVVLSNPYPADDDVMSRVCDGERGVEVICVRPDLLTTRGEAIAMRELADERSWETIIVVTWRYHLPRARFVFRQCYSGHADDTVMTAVPRSYDFSVPEWELTYAYQFAGFAKAAIQGDCS